VAIALNPNDAQAHRNRGLFLARARRYDEAMCDFDAALAINRSDPHAHGLRGLVWEKRGDVKRALSDLEAAIAQAPAHFEENFRRPAGRASVKKRDPVIQVAFLQVVHSRFDVVAEWLCENPERGRP
jgi:tetratricopeptide (TPR) repeat protein